MQIELASWQPYLAKNWTIHKSSILAALAAAALGSLSLKVNYDAPIEEKENLISRFSLLATSGIIAVEGIVYIAQRIITKKNNEAFIIGPALTAAGASLIFAAGYCPVLDFPSAAFAMANGLAFSAYGIWWTAAAHFHQDLEPQDRLLPL